jgi:hypothetical protein
MLSLQLNPRADMTFAMMTQGTRDAAMPAGGNSVAIWLENNFIKYIEKFWNDGKSPGALSSAPCSWAPTLP